MNKLEERFFKIALKCFKGKDKFYLNNYLVKETKNVAIEFVKKVLNSKIKVIKSGHIGKEENAEEYWPEEFQLMLGEILKNGDKIFDKFIKEYYE